VAAEGLTMGDKVLKGVGSSGRGASRPTGIPNCFFFFFLMRQINKFPNMIRPTII